MLFHKFIEQRDPPFRSCDIFDEVHVLIYNQVKRENYSCSTTVFEHNKKSANQLLSNVKKIFFFNFISYVY